MVDDALTVDVVTAVDTELVEAWTRLAPQLAAALPGAPEVVPQETLEAVVAADATTMLVARSGGAVVGTVTAVVFPLSSGGRGWIEDLVVDESARGEDVAERLVRAAVEHCVARGARHVDLASRMSRTEAQVLNHRAGFELRPVAVYRLTPSARNAG